MTVPRVEENSLANTELNPSADVVSNMKPAAGN